MAPGQLNATMRRLFRLPVCLYRWRFSWLLGHRFLLLVHTGRRTGLLRYTVLEVLEFRNVTCEAIVMSGWGRNADWPRNIKATPDCIEIVIGSRQFKASYRLLGDDEAIDAIASYERRNRLLAPIVRAGFTWVLGWRYDGSDMARRRVAAEKPCIAFRPLR